MVKTCAKNGRHKYCITALTWRLEGRKKVGRPNVLGWSSWNRNRGKWKECTASVCATRLKEDSLDRSGEFKRDVKLKDLPAITAVRPAMTIPIPGGSSDTFECLY